MVLFIMLVFDQFFHVVLFVFDNETYLIRSKLILSAVDATTSRVLHLGISLFLLQPSYHLKLVPGEVPPLLGGFLDAFLLLLHVQYDRVPLHVQITELLVKSHGLPGGFLLQHQVTVLHHHVQIKALLLPQINLGLRLD